MINGFISIICLVFSLFFSPSILLPEPKRKRQKKTAQYREDAGGYSFVI